VTPLKKLLPSACTGQRSAIALVQILLRLLAGLVALAALAFRPRLATSASLAKWFLCICGSSTEKLSLPDSWPTRTLFRVRHLRHLRVDFSGSDFELHGSMCFPLHHDCPRRDLLCIYPGRADPPSHNPSACCRCRDRGRDRPHVQRRAVVVDQADFVANTPADQAGFHWAAGFAGSIGAGSLGPGFSTGVCCERPICPLGR
jgi:hypothetical protein